MGSQPSVLHFSWSRCRPKQEDWMKKMIKSVRPAYAHTMAHAVVLEEWKVRASRSHSRPRSVTPEDQAVQAHPPAGLPSGFTPGSPVSTQNFLDFIQKKFFNKIFAFKKK